jgi:hypothetical protein
MRDMRNAYAVSQTKPIRTWIAARKLTWSVTVLKDKPARLVKPFDRLADGAV